MRRALGAAAAAGLLLVSCREGVSPQLANIMPPANGQAPANGKAPAPATTDASALPALTGRVVDNANLLTPAQEATLSARSEALEEMSGSHFVIVTVPTMGGQTTAQYSLALANHWRMDRNTGVMLLIAPTERQIRIAVGERLTSAFSGPDAQAIIDRDMIPAFRESRFFDGIDRATLAIAARVTMASGRQGARR